jgi:hypothetical protein
MNIFVPLANAILLLEGTSVLYQASHYILPFELTVSESNPIASRYFEAITLTAAFLATFGTENPAGPTRGFGFNILSIILEFCMKSRKAN